MFEERSGRFWQIMMHPRCLNLKLDTHPVEALQMSLFLSISVDISLTRHHLQLVYL